MRTYNYKKKVTPFSTRMLQLFLAVVSTAICFIPLWIFLFTYHVAGPTGFWQKLAVLGIGALVGGGIQVALFIWWVISLIWIAVEID